MRSNNFRQIYDRAKQKRNKGYLKQAKIQYQYLQKNFNSLNSQDINATDYIAMVVQLGDIQRQLKQLNQSRKTYQKAIICLNNAKKNEKNVSQYQIEKQKYHVYSNLALTQIELAQSIQDKVTEYDQLKRLTDSASNYYEICQKIVCKMITQGIAQGKNNQGNNIQEKQWWWKNQYIALTINRVNSFEIQAFQYKDRRLLQAIITLIQKAQLFYELCKTKTRLRLQKNLSKCYYSKAICLKFLDRFKQSQKYFKKDFQYCKQNNLKVDFKKTSYQMLKLYCYYTKFKQARSYALSIQQKQTINYQQQKYKQLKKKMAILQMQLQKQLRQKKFQVNYLDLGFDELLLELNDSQDFNLKQQIKEFLTKMKSSKQFKSNQLFRYYIFYYTALNQLKFQNYAQALRAVKQALNLVGSDKRQQIWCMMLQTQILSKTSTDRNIIIRSWKQYQQKAKLQQFQIQQQECKNKLKQYLFWEKRNKRVFNFKSQQSDELFEYMKRQRMRKQTTTLSRSQRQSQSQHIISQPQMQQQSLRPQRRLTRQLTSHQQYLQNCKLLTIQPLKQFQTLLQSQRQIKLSQLFFYPSEQILLLLKSTSFIEDLDIRNVQVSTQLMKKLQSCENIYNMKSIKVNLINGNSNISDKKNTKNQFLKEFQELLKKMASLEDLWMSNLYNYDDLKMILQSKQINALTNVKSLTLKQCNLDDGNLQFLLIHDNFPILESLSLQANNIQGNTLDCLTFIKCLKQLDLSQNPLTNININQPFPSLKSIILNYLTNDISEQNTQKFIYLFLRCQKIYMKNCQKICITILQNCVNNLINNQTNLYNLIELSLFNSVIDYSKTAQTLIRLKVVCPQLKKIDLRNCRILAVQHHEGQQNYIEQIQNKLNELLNKNYSHNVFNENPQQVFNLKTNNLSFGHYIKGKNKNKFDII